MVKNFRNIMAQSIVDQGDKLITVENFRDGLVVMWIIYDHQSEGDAFGRAPQYQVWEGDSRGYVGSDMKCAYNDYNKRVKSIMEREENKQ